MKQIKSFFSHVLCLLHIKYLTFSIWKYQTQEENANMKCFASLPRRVGQFHISGVFTESEKKKKTDEEPKGWHAFENDYFLSSSNGVAICHFPGKGESCPFAFRAPQPIYTNVAKKNSF